VASTVFPNKNSNTSDANDSSVKFYADINVGIAKYAAHWCRF
jgi:hypothetical protein